MKFTTPILLLIFNRPENTYKVFNKICSVKPAQLFIAADGPRSGNKTDIKLCDEARNIIQEIDWECDVNTLFRENNLGCKKAVFEAISWFFNNVEEGIIIEDDCIPNDSFFHFCNIMLDKYKCKRQVKAICGTNYLFGKYNRRNSYYFSPFIPIWGWATWKDTWDEVSLSLESSKLSLIKEIIDKTFINQHFCNWLYSNLAGAILGKEDSWGSFFTASLLIKGGLSVTPFRNLVANIGMDGTHINKGEYMPKSINMPTKNINIEKLSHPKRLEIDRNALENTIRNINEINLVPTQSLLNNIINYSKKLLRELKNSV